MTNLRILRRKVELLNEIEFLAARFADSAITIFNVS
jgi:hypothetical protein